MAGLKNTSWGTYGNLLAGHVLQLTCFWEPGYLQAIKASDRGRTSEVAYSWVCLLLDQLVVCSVSVCWKFSSAQNFGLLNVLVCSKLLFWKFLTAESFGLLQVFPPQLGLFVAWSAGILCLKWNRRKFFSETAEKTRCADVSVKGRLFQYIGVKCHESIFSSGINRASEWWQCSEHFQ